MQCALVALQYEEVSGHNILIKINFCNFTIWMQPFLRCPGPSPRSPPSARHWILNTGTQKSRLQLAPSTPLILQVPATIYKFFMHANVESTAV